MREFGGMAVAGQGCLLGQEEIEVLAAGPPGLHCLRHGLEPGPAGRKASRCLTANRAGAWRGKAGTLPMRGKMQ